MSKEEERADEVLINELIRLHNDHDKAHDSGARGQLANLRYGLRDQLHADYDYGRVFSAFPRDALTDNDERNEWRTVIAALFGLAHDELCRSQDDPKKPLYPLGWALRELYNELERESLERRFMTLLNADKEHLPGHLRQAIGLLQTKSIGLNWKQLLDDVCRWEAAGKPVQKQWAKDYYRARKTDAETSTTNSDDESTEGE